MKKFMVETRFGVRKVYKENSDYRKREIVADFVDGPEGNLAYAYFRESLARNGGSLREMGTGIYLVGDLDQLDDDDAGERLRQIALEQS